MTYLWRNIKIIEIDRSVINDPEVFMPKRVDRDKKKDMILQAAMRLFAKKGIADTRMEEVAVAANIAKGTIYEYFENRDELLDISFNYLLVLMNKLVRQRMADSKTPDEKIKAGFLAYLDIAALGINDYVQILPDLWAHGIRGNDQESETTFDLSWIYHQFREQYMEVIKAGIEQGRFRSMDVDAVASSLTAAADGLYLQWMADRGNFDLKRSAEAYISTFIDGIRANQKPLL